MTFDEVLTQVLDLLQREGRVSYRALKRRFDLDDDYLEDVKAEIIQAKRLAMDEDGVVLVWVGAATTASASVRASMTPLASPGDQAVPAEPPGAARDRREAERRQLTVLFCDLVDSTALAGQLDPEELREVVRAYQATCAEVIQRFEGHIAQYLGDGLLVYFGYPQAHEDDAQRAVRTGLGMVDALQQLNARLQPDKGIQLAVRLGIHTGLVVVGEIGGGAKHEQLALGETPNIAARLQGLADPDTVVISAATYRLVQGFFACRDLGSHPLKGVSTPVPVYRILGVSGAQGRLEVAGPTGLTPLVGREQEVGLLLERWAQVKEGEGQLVLLSGEAGIGKSRLVHAVKDRVSSEPHVRWECRCSPYAQNSSLYPVLELMQRALQFHQDDAPDKKLSKLEGALAPYVVSLPDVVPLLASLLSVPLSDRYPPFTLTPERRRQKTLEAVLAVLVAVAAQQPVLFIVEDLHWADPSTLELLGLFIDQGPTARILTLLAFRPDFRPPWGFRTHLTHLTLARLPRQQAKVMVEQVVGNKTLPAAILEQVVARTDGVPLFVEELTKMVLESGLLQEREDRYELTGPLPALAIPATLHDSLMARLDRLAPVKEVAQLGATLGRAFPYALLQAVSPQDEPTLQLALARLVEAELLYQRGVPPQATYLFKHALIQDTAYQSLLKSTRQQYHQRIAQVLEARFAELVETQPELLAHHYTEAGLIEQAVGYWHKAGQKASERSAHVEAINHLTRGLEVLTTLPDTPERAHQELDVQTTLGLALMATKGWAAPEAGKAYARAYALCRQLGEIPQLFAVLKGLRVFYHLRGEFQTARELGEQCLSLAQRQHDPALLLEAHRALAPTLYCLGELASARAHLEEGMALYDPQQHRAHAFLYGEDPGVGCRSYAAWVLWELGHPDQALQQSHEALTRARELAHPHSLAYALFYGAVLHQFRREGQAAHERAETLMVLSAEQGFALWGARGTILRGWTLALQGQGVEGIAQMRTGLAGYTTTGATLLQPYWLALLAEAYGIAGRTEEGLRALAGALAAVHRTGERFYEAELYRLKGELLLTRSADDQAAATTCFQHALAVARRQQAKSLELRAAMSLSRLWQQQGKRDAAHELLAPIYGWFTEGFDTADLKEAKALLEELSSS
jgi:TOMM system kinase/cyclase fusion protein